MAITDEQIAFVHDLFADLGQISTRKMFGGLGVYHNGTIFALLMSDGSVQMKGHADMSASYENAGWQQWTYTRKNGATSSMPYWRVPDDLLDAPDAICLWARKALAAL